MTKYDFEQFSEPISCESWKLKNINLENNTAEIILTDSDGQEFSHTFQGMTPEDSIEFIRTECAEKLKKHEAE